MAQQNAGLVALLFFRRSGPVLLRNPIFVIFQGWGGGGSGPPVPPLERHMRSIYFEILSTSMCVCADLSEPSLLATYALNTKTSIAGLHVYGRCTKISNT